MSYNEKIITEENGVLMVGVIDGDGSYCLWQTELSVGVDSESGVHFEFDGQANGGYDMVRECTVDRDAIHIVLASGELHHFYFPPAFDKHEELKEGLKRVYGADQSVLEFID